MYSTVLTWLALLGASRAQQVGTYVSEVHPSLFWQKCTKSSGCTTVSGSIVLDANWRWIHKANSYSNCYTGNQWDASFCPDPATCANNCALDGADYFGNYGVVTNGNAITLKFTNRGVTNTVGSRVYLLADNSTYEMFKLQNREIAFDVDVSNLPCGLNGALYFTGMDADGGVSKYPSNKAGAKYGTGYCDAQCPRDLHFINGEANVMNWTPSPFYPGDGTGLYGSCCSEMDVWEANYISNAYTAHPCTVSSPTRCSGSQCTSAGYCDPEGCDFNPYRMGNKAFYGKGYTIDTTQKITVVTQFLTSDGTATGALSEIRRLYIQNGVIIQNVKTNIPGMADYDSITEPFSIAQKAAFGNPDYFADKGGMKSMTKASEKGMVLAMSISDDPQTGMLWLDGNYPVGADPSKPGVGRGTCPTYSTGPVPLPIESPLPSVTFSNIRFGELNSTYNGTRFGVNGF